MTKLQSTTWSVPEAKDGDRSKTFAELKQNIGFNISNL